MEPASQQPARVPRQLRQHRPARPRQLASRSFCRTADEDPGQADRLVDDVRRLQALRQRQLPRGLPHQCHRPHRVRHRLHPAGRLQWLPRLHLGLPLRRHRLQQQHRDRAKVHLLLRPSAKQPQAGLRNRLSDAVDQVRPARRDAPDCRQAARRAPPAGHEPGAHLRQPGVRRVARLVPDHR